MRAPVFEQIDNSLNQLDIDLESHPDTSSDKTYSIISKRPTQPS